MTKPITLDQFADEFGQLVSRFASPSMPVTVVDGERVYDRTAARAIYDELARRGWTLEKLHFACHTVANEKEFWPQNPTFALLEAGQRFRQQQPETDPMATPDEMRERAVRLLESANAMMVRDVGLPAIDIPDQWTRPLPADYVVPNMADVTDAMAKLKVSLTHPKGKSAMLAKHAIKARLRKGQSRDSLLAGLTPFYPDAAEVVAVLAAEVEKESQ